MPRDQIQFYNPNTQTLQHPQSYKIRKFLEAGCLKKVHQDLWECRPLLGYNSTTYRLRRTQIGDFDCNCQGYYKYKACSHTMALEVLLKQQGDAKQGSMF